MNTITVKTIKLEDSFENNIRLNNQNIMENIRKKETEFKNINKHESSLLGEKPISLITSSLTSLNSDKFDDGWIDSGTIISFSDALKKLK